MDISAQIVTMPLQTLRLLLNNVITRHAYMSIVYGL